MHRLSHSRLSPATYIGQLATRCILPDLIYNNGSSFSFNARTYHYARDNITAAQLAFPGWAVTAGTGEVNITASYTVAASIEYPSGTFYQILFSGSATGTVGAGATLISDVNKNVYIPNGAKFYTRIFFTGQYSPLLQPGGNPPAFILDIANGDATDNGASNLTLSGTITDAGGGTFVPPCAIIGPTTRPSIGLVGDSRMVGYGAASAIANVGDSGEAAITLGPRFAYINTGVYGDTIASYVATSGSASTKRRALLAYCSHIINEYGVNDIVDNAVSAATVTADTLLIYGFAGIAGKPIFQHTLMGESTSTNSWATTAAQTTVAQNSVLNTFNATVRTGGLPYTGYHDPVVPIATSTTSGIWNAPGYTTDGIHCTQTGYNAIASGGVIDPNRFRLVY
jgi:lysophospholipase L1-like esterase